MNAHIKDQTIKRLAQTHDDLEKSIKGLDLELVIHPETGWMIRDILGHIAIWDRILIRAINTFLSGSEYIIPGMVGDETDFNEAQVKAQKKFSSDHIYQEWIQARKDFIEAVDNIPAGRFTDELAFPWGDESGSLKLMIEYMIEHNGEHQQEIQDALK